MNFRLHNLIPRGQQHGRQEFARKIEEFFELGHDEQALCDMFDVSVPALRRWRSAEEMPRPVMRAYVLDQLKTHAQPHAVAHAS